jgi:hypothetical protein
MRGNSSNSEEKYTNPGSLETEEPGTIAYIVSVDKERLLLPCQLIFEYLERPSNLTMTIGNEVIFSDNGM